MITVDMTKAKVIAHDARRAARNAAFAPLDIKATIPAESEAAEAARATIRTNDAALQVSMDAASDADALSCPGSERTAHSLICLFPGDTQRRSQSKKTSKRDNRSRNRRAAAIRAEMYDLPALEANELPTL